MLFHIGAIWRLNEFGHGTVRLELAFLARDETGHVYTPLRQGRAAWPRGVRENDVGELRGVRARIISAPAHNSDKSEANDDVPVVAQDRADLAVRARLG